VWIHRWWHAGEDGANVVYSSRIGVYVVIEFLVLAGSWLLFPFLHDYPVVFYILAVTLTGPIIGERRRAIIFTPDEVIFRPSFGRLSRIQVQEIVELRQTATMRTFCFRPDFIAGAELTLADGRKEILPLDFPNGSEIYKRLRAVAMDGSLRRYS